MMIFVQNIVLNYVQNVHGNRPLQLHINDIQIVQVNLANGETQQLVFGICIVAAGADSGKIAQLAKVGNGKGFLSTPLPVEPR